MPYNHTGAQPRSEVKKKTCLMILTPKNHVPKCSLSFEAREDEG